jgi:hypothetical protein
MEMGADSHMSSMGHNAWGGEDWGLFFCSLADTQSQATNILKWDDSSYSVKQEYSRS